MSQARTSLRAGGHVPSSRGRRRSGESHGFRAPSLPFFPSPQGPITHGPFAIRLAGCACSTFPTSRQPWSAGSTCARSRGDPTPPPCSGGDLTRVTAAPRSGRDQGSTNWSQKHQETAQGHHGNLDSLAGLVSLPKLHPPAAGSSLPLAAYPCPPLWHSSQARTGTLLQKEHSGSGAVIRDKTLCGAEAALPLTAPGPDPLDYLMSPCPAVPMSCCHPLSQRRSRHSFLELLPPPSLPRTWQGPQLCPLCSELPRARERQPWEEPAAGRRERPRRNAQTSAIPTG